MAHTAEDDALASEHLTGSAEQLSPAAAVPRGGSNSRALKIAGLTTLACLLVCSQLFTAYIVFDQRQQIQTLQKHSDRLSRDVVRTSQVRTPVKMQMPMNSLLMNFDVDQPVSDKSVPDQPVPPSSKPDFPVIKTKCQIEATTGASKFGTFKPKCDEQGQYQPKQCWHATGICWCVDETGAAIKDTATREKLECKAHGGTATTTASPIID